MDVGILPREEPGVFRSLLLPETADALAAGEAVTALALTENGLALGAVAGYIEGERFCISSLYVAPDHRRRGGGMLLLDTLALLAAPYAQGMVCRFTVTREEHQTLIPFLRDMGFRPEDTPDERIYQTTLEAVTGFSFFAGANDGFGTPLAQLNAGACSVLEQAARRTDAPLPEGGFSAPALDREVSSVVMQGSEPTAFVLLERRGAQLVLSSAWSDGRSPAALPMLLRSALVRARKRYAPDTALTVQTTGSASAALVRTLMPDAASISYTYARPL